MAQQHTCQPQPPISILCDDLLCYIFRLNATTSYSAFFTTVSTSQVCGLWRHLAVSYPELWRRYAFLDWAEGKGYSPWTEEVIRRSRECGLDVGWRRKQVLVESRIRSGCSGSSSPIGPSIEPEGVSTKVLNPGLRHSNDELRAELSRIAHMRSLFLPLFGGCTQWSASSCFFGVPGSAEKLEELELMAWANSQRGLRVLPSKFLESGGEGAETRGPALRKLTLKHCWIDFDFSANRIRLDVLQELELASTAYLDLMPGKPGSKWSDYLRVLEKCASLQILKLQFCRLAEDDIIDADTEPRGFLPVARKRGPLVHLLMLKRLEVRSRLKEVQAVLDTVGIPPGCGVDVQVDGLGAGWSSDEFQMVWNTVTDGLCRVPDLCFDRGTAFPSISLSELA